MATRRKPPATTPDGRPWHKVQIDALKYFESEWSAWSKKEQGRDFYREQIKNDLRKEGVVVISLNPRQFLASNYAMEAGYLTSCPERVESRSSAIHLQTSWKALDFRKIVGISLPTESQPMRAFRYSMRAMQPVMLSHWEEAAACAEQLVATAHKEMRVGNPAMFPKRWGKGTSDAFNVFLMAQAFDIPCHFQPAYPLIPEYQGVLDHWRTPDLPLFQQVMQAAAEYHISRARSSTNREEYEFSDVWDQLYPAELLAIQALRRREGLPEFETGHIYIDTPWSLIRNLPPAEPDPLLEQVVARLRQDYPTFR